MTPDYRPVVRPLPVASPVERQMLLSQAVAGYTASGWRFVARDSYSVILTTNARTNHILHLLITVFTCALWAPVWALIAA